MAPIAEKFRVIVAALSLLAIFTGWSAYACADISVTLNKRNSGELIRLSARSTPITEAIERVSRITGAKVHYSQSLQKAVTADCAGDTVVEVLDCLFAQRASFVARYSKLKPGGRAADKLESEVWILGVQATAELSETDTCNGSTCSQTCIGMGRNGSPSTVPVSKKLRELVESIKAGDPRSRRQAIADLATETSGNLSSAKEALTEALDDPDASIRAQAISTLAQNKRFKEADLTNALRKALDDQDPTVRMMALENIGDRRSLLESAVHDTDVTIREVASAKLQGLQ